MLHRIAHGLSRRAGPQGRPRAGAAASILTRPQGNCRKNQFEPNRVPGLRFHKLGNGRRRRRLALHIFCRTLRISCYSAQMRRCSIIFSIGYAKRNSVKKRRKTDAALAGMAGFSRLLREYHASARKGGQLSERWDGIKCPCITCTCRPLAGNVAPKAWWPSPDSQQHAWHGRSTHSQTLESLLFPGHTLGRACHSVRAAGRAIGCLLRPLRRAEDCAPYLQTVVISFAV
jgi:hypothetical protein